MRTVFSVLVTVIVHKKITLTLDDMSIDKRRKIVYNIRQGRRIEIGGDKAHGWNRRNSGRRKSARSPDWSAIRTIDEAERRILWRRDYFPSRLSLSLPWYAGYRSPLTRRRHDWCVNTFSHWHWSEKKSRTPHRTTNATTGFLTVKFLRALFAVTPMKESGHTLARYGITLFRKGKLGAYIAGAFRLIVDLPN